MSVKAEVTTRVAPIEGLDDEVLELKTQLPPLFTKVRLRDGEKPSPDGVEEYVAVARKSARRALEGVVDEIAEQVAEAARLELE